MRRAVAFAGSLPADEASWSRGRVDSLLAAAGGEWRCLKHYFPEAGTMKLFLRGGATLTVDLRRGEGLYEEIRRRPLLSGLNRLHYNPSRWWTLFSDLFLAGLVVIVLTGLVMVRGPKGLWGRGGVELLAGMVIPLLFLFLLECLLAIRSAGTAAYWCRKRSQSSAAMQPDPAAVMACR